MKIFANIWKYLAFLFAGMVAGIMAAIKLLDSKVTVTGGTYVKDQKQETRIGTVKQKKGIDNLQDVTQMPEQAAADSRKARRVQRRTERKAKRKGVLSDEEENQEV